MGKVPDATLATHHLRNFLGILVLSRATVFKQDSCRLLHYGDVVRDNLGEPRTPVGTYSS